jgi:hypothetical protein
MDTLQERDPKTGSFHPDDLVFFNKHLDNGGEEHATASTSTFYELDILLPPKAKFQNQHSQNPKSKINIPKIKHAPQLRKSKFENSKKFENRWAHFQSWGLSCAVGRHAVSPKHYP